MSETNRATQPVVKRGVRRFVAQNYSHAEQSPATVSKLPPRQATTTFAPFELRKRFSWARAGDQYLPKLLILGMTALVRNAKYKPERTDPRLSHFMAREPTHVATVALANKTARVVWAIMTRRGIYQSQHMPVLAV